MIHAYSALGGPYTGGLVMDSSQSTEAPAEDKHAGIYASWTPCSGGTSKSMAAVHPGTLDKSGIAVADYKRAEDVSPHTELDCRSTSSP